MIVVVLSRDSYVALGAIRALAAAGHIVDLIASSSEEGEAKAAASSRFVRNYKEVVTEDILESGRDFDLFDALMEHVGKCEEKAVLLPTDDYALAVADRYKDALSEHYIMPHFIDSDENGIPKSMAYCDYSDLAAKAGLHVRKEWLVALSDEISIPEDIVYPCYSEILENVAYNKRKNAICRDESDLRTYLDEMQEDYPESDVLVQEYLQMDSEISLSAVCADQHIIIPAILKKLNISKAEDGAVMAGKVLPVEDLGEKLENIMRMLRDLRFVGMVNMDLSISEGELYFENLSLHGGDATFAYFMCGVNLPALYVKGVSGEASQLVEEKVYSVGWIYLNEAAAWKDYLGDFMSKQERKDRIATAHIKLVSSEVDPEPGAVFAKQMQQAVRENRLDKMKKWYRKKVRAFKRSKFYKWASKVKRSVRYGLRPVAKFVRNIKSTLMGYPQMKQINRRKPLDECPRVVVAGRNYSSNLAMARSVGMAGYEVEVLRIFTTRPKWTNLSRYIKPDAYSKYVKAFYICVSNRKAQNIINRLIRIADPYRKMLLIPADDLVAEVIDEFMDELSPYYIMPNVKNIPGEIGRLMSKEVQKRLAREAGLPVVNSCVLRTVNHQFEIPESVKYPCFIKPNASINGLKTRMRRCDSREELERIITQYSQRRDIEMLVEDFIEIENEYSILGLSTKSGVVAPGFFMAKQGGHDGRRGVALTGQLVPTAEAQQLIDDIVKFVGTLDFDGLFDVDLIMSTEKKLHFIELNLRYGGSGYAVVQGGANLPGMFADYMLKGKPVDKDCRVVDDHKSFVSEKIMLEEYLDGYLSQEDMKSIMESADIHFINDPNDAGAYKHFQMFYKPAAILKKIKALRK